MTNTKTILSILLIVLFSTLIPAQTTSQEVEKIATFCKVWGFLKYYHPAVATGNLDWDAAFIVRMKSLHTLTTKQEISDFYSTWISSLGTIKTCANCAVEADELTFNFDIDWLTDTTWFNAGLIKQLQFIRENRNQGKNHYVQQYKAVGSTNYKNEKPYRDSIFPTPALRLLGLARYWNIINYFYPYKYKTGQNWNTILLEMIPKFKDAPDTISYHLAMRELTARIDDTHADFSTKYIYRYFGLKWVPFYFRIIDNKAVVMGFYNDSLCKKDDIRYSDVFLTVNNKSIADIIAEQSKYIGASNDATRLRKFYYVIFNGNTDSVAVTFERDGLVKQKYISRHHFLDFKYAGPGSVNKIPYKILDGNIGYVDLGLLQRKQVQRAMKKLQHTTAIIFDVRNYPNGTLYELAKFLNDAEQPFAKFTYPDLSYPGMYRYQAVRTCGKKNSRPYAGQVVLLFDETSQSHAEFTLMALQTAPRVISMGSQTAGADGNVSEITFPGGYQTMMTGIGVYYPDGRETQRVGIVPDVEVKPTIPGIRSRKDEVLETAIETIRLQNQP